MFEVRIRDENDANSHRLCQWPPTKPIDELVSLIRSRDIYVGDTTVAGRDAVLSTQFVVDEHEEWAYLEIIVGVDDDGVPVGAR